MYQLAAAELTFTLGRFLRQDVTTVGLRMFVAARGRFPKALGGATVGLHLWHLVYS
jgi:hypothetical protein